MHRENCRAVFVGHADSASPQRNQSTEIRHCVPCPKTEKSRKSEQKTFLLDSICSSENPIFPVFLKRDSAKENIFSGLLRLSPSLP
jgi:hypothetical protein